MVQQKKKAPSTRTSAIGSPSRMPTSDYQATIASLVATNDSVNTATTTTMTAKAANNLQISGNSRPTLTTIKKS